MWVLKGKHIAVLGLAFKANTDDIRFAPALEVVKRLLDEGADVHASDPEAIDRAKALFPQAHYHEDPYEALKRGRRRAALHRVGYFSYSRLDPSRNPHGSQAGHRRPQSLFTGAHA